MPDYTVPKEENESAIIPAQDSEESNAQESHHVTLKDPALDIDKRFYCEDCGNWERSIIRFEFEPCIPSDSP